jgi:MoaA/NifB/PqqE/SkfB family radical SAM enzyme
MCDIWKANHDKRELSAEDLEKHVQDFRKWGVREVAFSGGEALMHSNLWRLCSLLKNIGIRISLLSTGLLLDRHAENIVTHCDEVIVSIDGSELVHDRIRNIPKAFEKLASGIHSLRALHDKFIIKGRCVLQRYNYADFKNIICSAKTIGLNQISFLPADVTSQAFNRPETWSSERVNEIALTAEELSEFKKIIEESIIEFRADYETKFIAESPSKMRKLVQYYEATLGQKSYPKVVCNAPWVSAVIESNGDVLPCFFHKPYGNIYRDGFINIVNSEKAIQFRRKLNVNEDATCQKCVCSLKLGLRQLK